MENSFKFLPRVIQKALDRSISSKINVDGLVRPIKTCLLVLQQLIRCVDAIDQAAPIYIKKDTLADKLGASKPTVDRALKALEEGGWIIRQNQIKSRKRGFQIGAITLTTQAIEVLFPTVRQELPESTPTESKPLCESKLSHALNDSLVTKVTTSSSKEERHPAAPSSFDREQEKRIEPNLRSLLTHLTPKTINWLKGKARQNGKLLEHIVLATQAYAPKTKQIKAYLIACIQSETDFKAKMDYKNKIKHEVALKEEVKVKAQTFQLQYVDQLIHVQASNYPYALPTKDGMVMLFKLDPRLHFSKTAQMPAQKYFENVISKMEIQSLGLFSYNTFLNLEAQSRRGDSSHPKTVNEQKGRQHKSSLSALVQMLKNKSPSFCL
jgi:Mn-dependent DtxR family transcriptional regulator/uncharacterized protein involved in tolerance to divalent cations